MAGSRSAPPPLINFPSLFLSCRGSSSSRIQNDTVVTRQKGELPGKVLKRKRSSDVSTELVLYKNPWKITKELTQSDLGQLSRLLLPLGRVEAHVLLQMDEEKKSQVKSDDGMEVVMKDMGTNEERSFVFRCWGSSGSYVLNKGWTQQFVKQRGLKVGDEIGMFRDPDSGMFYFTVFPKVARATSNPAA